MVSLKDFVLSHHQDARERCPDCSDARKKKSIKTLSITVKHDQTLYHCHHCGLSGSFRRKKFYEEYMKEDKVVRIPTQLNYNVEQVKSFFLRGASSLTVLMSYR